MRFLLVALLCACTSTEGDPFPSRDPAAGAHGPRFFEDVAPLLRESCQRCHVAGGIAPFALVSYEDVVAQAPKVKEMVATRQMPPDLVNADGSCGEWKGVDRLSDEEIATIVDWVDGAREAGDPAKAPPMPPPPRTLDDATDEFDIGADYVPDARLDDDYRCFVIDAPDIAEDQFLTAYEFTPGDPRVVHHAILFALDSANAEARALAHEAEDDRPGYTCFGATRTGSDFPIAAWAPGVPATEEPAGTGVRVHAGRKLVLQVHYNLAQGVFVDRSRMKLRLVPSVAKEAINLPLAATDLQLAPGRSRVEATYTLTVPPIFARATVHGVFPHMHTLGTTLRVERTRVGYTTCVLDVPRWDFHWQRFYEYATPIDVKPFDIVTITCGYDTTTRQTTVTWGEGTDDEMCLVGFYLTMP